MDLAAVKDTIEKNDIRTVIVAGTDPAGVLRGKRLTVPYFYHALKDGITFASYILGTTTMDEVLPGLFDTGIPDLKGVLDFASFRLAPWEDAAAIIFMDWQNADGTPSALCPRSTLKQQVARANGMGFAETASLELEFYLLPVPLKEVRLGRWSDIQPASKDIHCYSIFEGYFWEPIVSKIRDCFPTEVEACLPEWGQGQFEINLHRTDAVSMADNAMLLKLAVKQIAAGQGVTATFMAKFREDLSGSSGHIHLSLRDRITGESVFYDPARPLKLSRTFENFVAGQLDVFAPSALFYAPNVNSYKRFQSLSFAGTTKNWGIDNRTVGFPRHQPVGGQVPPRDPAWRGRREPLSRHRHGPRRRPARDREEPRRASGRHRECLRRRRGAHSQHARRGSGRGVVRRRDPRSPAAGGGRQCAEDRPLRTRRLRGHGHRSRAPPIHGDGLSMARVERFDVLIVGAGISGIGSAHHLQEQCPGKSFVILESHESFGGTWLIHRYPGTRSDSDLYTFGFRFKPWTEEPIATRERILAYLEGAIAESGLGPHIRYGHEVRTASWSGETKLWTVTGRCKDTGEPFTVEANFLWMCQGYYRHAQGYTPDWPGMDSFKGRIVHPQTWPEDLDYSGKRVLVIGSGATAATLIPAMRRNAHTSRCCSARRPTSIPATTKTPWRTNSANSRSTSTGSTISSASAY